MSKLSRLNIDGDSIIKSIVAIIDAVKHRKYAKKGFTTVVMVNDNNTAIKMMEGIIDDEGKLNVKGIDIPILMHKQYIMSTKNLITNCVLCKEGINTTIDLEIKDMSRITPVLFKEFTKVKLLKGLASFDVGQVIMGAALGIIIGGMLTFSMILVYNSFL